MTSSMASYEQLVRQVEALKAENTNLRQELRDNSSHLSKLETETSGMKVRVCMEAMAQKHSCPESAEREVPGGPWAATMATALLPTMSTGGPETPPGQAGAGGAGAGVLRADRSVRTTER